MHTLYTTSDVIAELQSEGVPITDTVIYWLVSIGKIMPMRTAGRLYIFTDDQVDVIRRHAKRRRGRGRPPKALKVMAGAR